MSVLYWGLQNWIRYPRCDLTIAQQRGKITSFNLLALLFALQPWVGSWEHCLLMLNFLSSRNDLAAFQMVSPKPVLMHGAEFGVSLC